MHNVQRAFTLLELLVVVAVIALLVTILVPAMERAMEKTTRTVCGTNLAAIHKAMAQYALQNKQEVVACLRNNVNFGFSVAQADALQTVGLTGPSKVVVAGGSLQYPPAKVWNCPARGYASQWEGTPELFVGYLYMGGMQKWVNPSGTIPSRSPEKLHTSQPGWVLSGDANMKIDNAWGAGRATAFAGMPSHKEDHSPRPSGGNQVYVDGSVHWVTFDEMVMIHDWRGNGTGKGWWYQADLGYTPDILTLGSNEP